MATFCRDTLSDRGPNDCGLYVSGAVALAHRRLSIIDLSESGRMPMSNEVGDIWATFNGEIYNFAELRSELIGYGHQFRSGSDSEIIVHAYEQWGVNCFEKFDGMFAIGLWDQRLRQMVLARDPHGKKPLFYYLDPAKLFLFGSTLQPLVAWPEFPRTINRESVYEFVDCETTHSSTCWFENTHRVEPGSYAILRENGSLTSRRFWDLAQIAQLGKLPFRDDQEAIDELERLLRCAVRKRLVADVPIGAFLSGGIDSSLVVALMSQELGCNVSTYTAGFVPRIMDESDIAQEVASKLGVANKVYSLTDNDIVPYVAEVARTCDEPIKHYSVLPMLALSRAAAADVRVVLTGDGGDEIFGGYLKYRWARDFDRYASLVNPAIRRLLARFGFMPPSRKLKWLVKNSGAVDAADFFGRLTNRAKRCQFEALLPADWKCSFDEASIVTNYIRALQPLRVDEAAMLYDTTHSMTEAILVKVDRATMAFGLEARCPLLDRPLSEFAVRMPATLRQDRAALKSILRRFLEPRIIDRRKIGFVPPVGQWFRGELRGLLTDTLSVDAVNRRGLFDGTAVSKLIGDHLAGKQDYTIILWSLLMVEIWLREVVDTPRPQFTDRPTPIRRQTAA